MPHTSEVYREARFQWAEIDFRDIQEKLGISRVRDIKKGEFQLKKKRLPTSNSMEVTWEEE